AQSHVQGKPLAHLKIILHVECEHALSDALVAFFPDWHPTEKLRLGQDEVLDVLKRVLTSRFRLDRIVVLDAPDDTAPFEVVATFDVGQIIAKLPEVVDPASGKVGIGADFRDCWCSTLFTYRQRSDDLAGNKGERLRKIRSCKRVGEL